MRIAQAQNRTTSNVQRDIASPTRTRAARRPATIRCAAKTKQYPNGRVQVQGEPSKVAAAFTDVDKVDRGEELMNVGDVLRGQPVEKSRIHSGLFDASHLFVARR